MRETGQFESSGKLLGHKKYVTSISTSAKKPDMIVSSSRDCKLLSWKIEKDQCEVSGKAIKEFSGHDNFVSDVTLSSDGLYAMSSSWDKSLCLWDIETAKQTRRFVGHTEEIFSLSMSADNRQIVSASADGTVRLWNTMGQCKYVFKDEGYSGTVSSVCLTSTNGLPIMVSGSHDKVVKAWTITKPNLIANMHTASSVVCTAFSPDSMLIAAGTSQGRLYMWYLETFLPLTDQLFGESLRSVAFKPDSNVLAVSSGNKIHLLSVSDLLQRVLKKNVTCDCPVIQTLSFEEVSTEHADRKMHSPDCTCLTWSPDGQILYAGYNDGHIRVWIWKSESYEASSSQNREQ